MKRKFYRTLNGLFKALQKQKSSCASYYTFQKKDEEIVIFNTEDYDAAISGVLIEDLLPVLKSSCWMVRFNSKLNRNELLAWIMDENL